MEPCAIKTSTSSCGSKLSKRLTNTAGDTSHGDTHGLSHALLPAIESTTGRIHGELLRLLCLLADKKPTRFCQALGEEVDVDSEIYCRRRSDDQVSVFRRMRATHGLACAKAAIYPVHSGRRQHPLPSPTPLVERR